VSCQVIENTSQRRRPDRRTHNKSLRIQYRNDSVDERRPAVVTGRAARRISKPGNRRASAQQSKARSVDARHIREAYIFHAVAYRAQDVGRYDDGGTMDDHWALTITDQRPLSSDG